MEGNKGMKLYAPSTVNEIRNRYGFKNSKSLGQNFLTDKAIIDKITDGAGIGPEDLVIEIGPGLGVITYEAALRAKKAVSYTHLFHLWRKKKKN